MGSSGDRRDGLGDDDLPVTGARRRNLDSEFDGEEGGRRETGGWRGGDALAEPEGTKTACGRSVLLGQGFNLAVSLRAASTCLDRVFILMMNCKESRTDGPLLRFGCRRKA